MQSIKQEELGVEKIKGLLYDMSPTSEQFEELRNACIHVWSNSNRNYPGAASKVRRLRTLPNDRSNFMWMLREFDSNKQIEVIGILGDNTKRAVRIRLRDGGYRRDELAILGL